MKKQREKVKSATELEFINEVADELYKQVKLKK